MNHCYLYAATRTPFGRLGGGLAGVRPDDLAASSLQSLQQRVPGLDPADVGDVVWGCANGAGEDNRNVGRMALLLAGWSVEVPATTVNRLCGSSLDAAMLGSRTVESGDADLVVAGGVESMTRAPWALPKPDRPFPAVSTTAVSTTLGWRLVNDRMRAEWTVSLGECNEQLAEEYRISRTRQDEFAARSHALADRAWQDGFYAGLVSPVEGTDLTRDEGIRPDSTTDRLAGLRPSFRPDGTITAGNASPLSDGASAVLLGSEGVGRRLGAAPLARFAGRGTHAVEPQRFGFRAGRGRAPGPPSRRDHVGRRLRRRAQRSIRSPGPGLRRRLGGQPGVGQLARRVYRPRSPAGRVRRATDRHLGPPAAPGRGAVGSSRHLHRRRSGTRRGPGERRSLTTYRSR